MLKRQMSKLTSDSNCSDFKVVRYVLSQEYTVLEMEREKAILTENIVSEK